MNKTTYNIVFDGVIDRSRTIDEVKKNLSILFKQDLAEIEQFFSGKPVLIKKNVDQATAEKSRSDLFEAGALCSVLPVLSDKENVTEKTKDEADTYFKVAQSLFRKGGKDKEAFAEMERCIQIDPDHWEAHYIYASRLLRTETALDKSAAKENALYHAQRAFELTGYTRLKVVKTLSDAMAENERIEEGLSLLENAYEAQADHRNRKSIEKYIESFRKKNKMGRLWQFFDPGGKLFYETVNIKLVQERLVNGIIPLYFLCRKNRVADMLPIKDLLAKNEPSIEMMISPVISHMKYGGWITGGIAGGVTGLYFVGKFLAYLFGIIPGLFAGWVGFGLQHMIAFVTFIILLGLPTLILVLAGLGIAIAVIGVLTGIIGGLPAVFFGGVIGGIVGVIRAPFIPKIGSKAGRVNT